MNGRTMSYKNYIKSLKETPEPIVKKMAIDYKGLIKFAREKGVLPCDLSDSEKKIFIIK